MAKKLSYEHLFGEMLENSMKLGKQSAGKFVKELFDADEYESQSPLDMVFEEKIAKIDYGTLIKQGHAAGIAGFWGEVSKYGDYKFNVLNNYGTLERKRALAVQIATASMAYGELELAEEMIDFGRYTGCETYQQIYQMNVFFGQIIDLAVQEGNKDVAVKALENQLSPYTKDDVINHEAADYGFRPGPERNAAQKRLDNIGTEMTKAKKNAMPNWIKKVRDNFDLSICDINTIKSEFNCD